MIRQLAILTITGLALFGITTAHADHVDNNIWIETADGKFVTENESIESEYRGSYIAIDNINNIFIDKVEYKDNYWEYDDEYRIGYEYTLKGELCAYDLDEPQTTWLNEVRMFESERGCGDRIEERKYLEANQASEISMTLDKYHECVCGYWYNNVVKDEYTYTILDLPKDVIDLPPDYKENIDAGIRDGLEQWSAINDIKFTYTDSRLKANIIIQQQAGNGNALGNAVIGCLFDNNQCTIQLFPYLYFSEDDLEVLMNRQSVEFTIAHEFGHLIGLPHHIDPEHVMNTVHANNVRTYYEAQNINVPSMTEPEILDQILLRIWDGYDVEHVTPHTTDKTIVNDTPTTSTPITKDYTDDSQLWTTDNFIEHKAVQETINVMLGILVLEFIVNPESDPAEIILDMFDKIRIELFEKVDNLS